MLKYLLLLLLAGLKNSVLRSRGLGLLGMSTFLRITTLGELAVLGVCVCVCMHACIFERVGNFSEFLSGS